MKPPRIHNALVLVTAFVLTIGAASHADTREVILSAMRDELARNIERLVMEDMARPFYISYTVYDVSSIEIRATLGALVRSEDDRHRNHSTRVMVGSYEFNDENFASTTSGYSSSMISGSTRLPIEDNYDGIRRALWIATDETYKMAAEKYERKKAAIEQQKLPAEALLDDFSHAPSVSHRGTPPTVTFDRAAWEQAAREVSALFAGYPDLYSSSVRVMMYRGEMYFVSREGTESVEPLTLAAVNINLYTQAEDGEPLSDHLDWYASDPQDLPDVAAMKRASDNAAQRLIALRKAPVFKDTYFGPVLLEGQAAKEFFPQRLFGGKHGLFSSRNPITSRTSGYGMQTREATLEDRMGRRILSRNFTIRALPHLDSYGGVRCIGALPVDCEGVIPPEEIVLVRDGILETLLSNRTPSLRVPLSNGHQRPVIGGGYWTGMALGPSVISIESDEGMPTEDLKRELLKRAVDEGMDYAILIRKLKPAVTGESYSDPMVRLTRTFSSGGETALSEPLEMYKVYVADGREELIRSASLSDISLSTLRHIAGVSSERAVYNTLATPGYSAGVPSTFIAPDAILLEELEVTEEKRDFTPRLPVIPSPLTVK